MTKWKICNRKRLKGVKMRLIVNEEFEKVDEGGVASSRRNKNTGGKNKEMRSEKAQFQNNYHPPNHPFGGTRRARGLRITVSSSSSSSSSYSS
jgi:hypothetical protein